MKIFKKVLIFILCLILSTSSLIGCKNKDKENVDKDVIQETDTFFVNEGKSDFVIVLPDEPRSWEAHAGNEMRDYVLKATNVTLNIIPESSVSSGQKNLLVLGETKMSDNAGIKVSKAEFGARGYVIKNMDSVVYIRGGDTQGTLYGVYEFLHHQFGFEVYAIDEIAIDVGVTSKKLLAFDLKDIPDIPYMQGVHEYYRYYNAIPGHRMRFNTYNEIFIGSDQPWHNVFTYVPKKKYQEQHPKWYTADGKELHYTAHGDKKELDALLDAVYENMVKMIEADFALGKYYEYIGFMQNDHPSSFPGSGSDARFSRDEIINMIAAELGKSASEINVESKLSDLGASDANIDQLVKKFNEKYIIQTDANALKSKSVNDIIASLDSVSELSAKYPRAEAAAMLVHFINRLQTKISAYMQEKNLKDADGNTRKMSIMFFAYEQSEAPPVTTDSNGNILPIDESVRVHDDATVFMALIRADYMHDYKDSGATARVDGWDAISKNQAFWFYNFYFNMTTFIYVDVIYSMQTYFQMAERVNAQYVFFESPMTKNNYFPFNNLNVYLYSKLGWDVDIDVHEHIDRFFKNYYKDASKTMREYFDSVTSYFAYLKDESVPITGVIGAQNADIRTNWNEGVLTGWTEYINKAFQDIEPLKYTNKTLYDKLYSRILYDSLMPRYLLMKHFATEHFTDESFRDELLQFKADCKALEVKVAGEGIPPIEELNLTR